MIFGGNNFLAIQNKNGLAENSREYETQTESCSRSQNSKDRRKLHTLSNALFQHVLRKQVGARESIRMTAT